MSYRTILVEVGAEAAAEGPLEAARALAMRFDAMLVGMHVAMLAVPFAAGDLSVYIPPEALEAQRQADLEVRERALAAFHRVCGPQGPRLAWRDDVGWGGLALAAAGCAADLIVAARGRPGAGALGDLVSAAGVPVLMVPPGAAGMIGRTVLLAWNGKREAARAAHDALPFLQAAERVVLCAIGEAAGAGLDDAAGMLRRHGVPVQALRQGGGDLHAGEMLLAQAVAHRADLLVMGAYGHSRLRELVVGGATRHVLHHATLPVLFSG